MSIHINADYCPHASTNVRRQSFEFPYLLYCSPAQRSTVLGAVSPHREPAIKFRQVKLRKVLNDIISPCANRFLIAARGHAQNSKPRPMRRGGAAGGVLDDQAEFFFNFGVKMPPQFLKSEGVTFRVGFAHAHVLDRDDFGKTLENPECPEQGGDFRPPRAAADAAGNPGFFKMIEQALYARKRCGQLAQVRIHDPILFLAELFYQAGGGRKTGVVKHIPKRLKIAVDDVIGEIFPRGDLEFAADLGREDFERVIVGGQVQAFGIGDDAVKIKNDAGFGHEDLLPQRREENFTTTILRHNDIRP